MSLHICLSQKLDNFHFVSFVQKKIVVEKDGMKIDVTFRKILLNKCQMEFEKEKSIEKKIHEKLEYLTKHALSVSTYYFAFH